ncbi:AAA family ATPase [Helicobacter monodelphidis]|uniref:AAA family ATPase n=1 Tax=Helicobacter sp. 15-1451 TaxID=2004995 RepID=UPI000DCCD1F0|nr:ATP-dependent metallopeptidase FtsH/Yme1/Tma family protein [Helicobacter sp. 15-1451]RAX59278.1 AAA family ATPase [Helicobacter sp. 15-1451]
MARSKGRNLLIGIVTLLFAVFLMSYVLYKDRAKLVSAEEMVNLVEQNQASYAYLEGGYLYLKINDSFYKAPQISLPIRELTMRVPLEIRPEYDGYSLLFDVVIVLFFIFIGIAFYRFFKKEPPIKERHYTESKKHQPFNREILTRSYEDREGLDMRISQTMCDVTFADVAGIKEVKEELEEIIDFLKNPQKYHQFGTKLPKGVLLMGPPGVGKTLIAKAMAGEAGIPFFYQSGSSFAQIYVGMGAKRVQDLFRRAKMAAPSIIFIDEIDAVGKARGGGRNDEREATLNQLLTEMDGFEDSKGVIVVGATNKIDVLDEALLRSGRFDRRIYVELPDFYERVKILEVHLKNKRYELDLEEISRLSVGFSGAALASLVNEAALRAIKRKSPKITMEDVLASKDKVVLGKRKQLSVSDEEKKILATYQAAKALAAYWMEMEFEKISLINEGIKEFDKELLSRSEIFNKIKILLSGITALEINYGESYSNCEEDLNKAKVLALEMAEKYGMGDKIIGDSYDALQILGNAKNEMKEFFESSKVALKSIEERLLEQERLSKEEIRNILKKVMF